MNANNISLEERVARLEGKLGWKEEQVPLQGNYFLAASGCLVVGIVLGYFGLGFPNHYYQLVLAALTVALCYHRNWLATPSATIHWILAGLNTLSLTLLYKLLIGGGHRYPISWLKYPVVEKSVPEGDPSKWLNVVPDFTLQWHDSALAAWSFDLTVIQTFLLLITLIGALFEFQPFISLTAFLLILVSLPALVGFSWAWVFPAIVVTGIAFYLQTAEINSVA